MSVLIVFILIGFGLSVFVSVFYIGRILVLRTLPSRRITSLSHSTKSTIEPNFVNIKQISQNTNLLKVKPRKQQDHANLFHSLIKELSSNHIIKEERARMLFEQAGIVLNDPLFVFITLKITLTFVSMALTWILASEHLLDFMMMSQFKSVYVVFMGFVGWTSLDLYLALQTRRRLLTIEHGFPDALDLMLICVGAGLNIEKCFERVAQEMTPLNKEIAKEFAITSIELEIMLDQKQALTNLANRVPSPIIRNFTSTIIQSVQQGTAVLHAFDILSTEIRQHRMHTAEIRAAQLPTKLLFPLLLLILPTLFILLLGPSVVKLTKMF